ncbi:MAG: alcohol dehydrogenase catalytic domain-containing protein [Bryobacterales bacterium]|nr:alcohol dehydrogenase catalytic domain-containing protein [Bryobacterales bacterium]
MRVAELVGLRQLRLTEAELPPPAPGEVQVRVEAVGVCGSDMHSYLEGAVGDTPARYPMVLGHEPAGVVEAVGAGVTGWSRGDRAVLEPAIYCYHCEFCLSGHHNVCTNLRFLSQPETPGFFRDRLNLPAANLLPLAPHLSFAEGTLAEPLAVALHSMVFARPQAGETALVLGAGPIGLLTMAVLKLGGARRVWVSEPLAHRRALAATMGADAVLDPTGMSVAETVLRETGGRGVDLAVDCAAKGDTHAEAILATRSSGRVVYTGIPSEIDLAVPFHPWRRKELALYQVRRSNHEGGRAHALLAERPRLFAPLLTHSRPLDAIAEAFSIVERYDDGVGKMIVSPAQ